MIRQSLGKFQNLRSTSQKTLQKMELFRKRPQIQLKGEIVKNSPYSYSFTYLLRINLQIKGEGCVISPLEICANVYRTADAKIKTKAPFPLEVKTNLFVNQKAYSVITIAYSNCKMKHKPIKNFPVSSPTNQNDSEDDTSENEERLRQDLRQGQLGAAFLPPQAHCQIWAQETPIQHPEVSSSSADNSLAIISETFTFENEADDEYSENETLDQSDQIGFQEVEVPCDQAVPTPSTSGNAVRIREGAIPIPIYHNAYGRYVNKYQEGDNPPYSISRTWREADPERDIRLIDSNNYPESSPEFMRVGPGYPDNDFRPSYNRCETGRYLRFHGFLDETADYIRSGNYYRDHPEPDANAVTCIHTCGHHW